MTQKNDSVGLLQSSVFDLKAIAAQFPATAETMLLDVRLTDETAASSRLFRVYRPVPAHFHKTCDEYLQVISGRARFAVESNEPVELGPGQVVFFRRNTVHAIPEIIEGPLVFFSVDTPRRDPSDVTFVDAAHGTAKEFIRTIGMSKSAGSAEARRSETRLLRIQNSAG
jgi:mannose-6-phosphate isomerase-like protein (cupin superfamily)